MGAATMQQSATASSRSAVARSFGAPVRAAAAAGRLIRGITAYGTRATSRVARMTAVQPRCTSASIGAARSVSVIAAGALVGALRTRRTATERWLVYSAQERVANRHCFATLLRGAGSGSRGDSRPGGWAAGGGVAGEPRRPCRRHAGDAQALGRRYGFDERRGHEGD